MDEDGDVEFPFVSFEEDEIDFSFVSLEGGFELLLVLLLGGIDEAI